MSTVKAPPSQDGPARPARPFRYSQLPPSSIRLFRLRHPPSRTANTPPVYTMAVFPVDATPVFHVLSVHWTPADPVVSIACDNNNTTLPVSRSLGAALAQVGALPEYTRAWLWSDQACLNPHDGGAERAAFGELAAAVFGRSLRTLVCLPQQQQHPNESDDNFTWDFAALLKHVCDRHPDLLTRRSAQVAPHLAAACEGWDGDMPAAGALSGSDDLVRLGLHPASHPVWRRVFELAAHPWFSRFHSVADVFLSFHVPVLVQTGRVRSLFHLMWARSFVVQNMAVFAPYLSEKLVVAPRPDPCELLLLATTKRIWTFDSLLWCLAAHAAPDPRDHYLGLRSLMAAAMPPMHSSPTALPELTHTTPPAELCAAYTRYVIEMTSSLLVLSLVNHEPGLPQRHQVPTWAYVPSPAKKKNGLLNFSGQYQLRGMPTSVRREGFWAGLRAEDHHASPLNEVQTLLLGDPKLLTLRGRVADAIWVVPHDERGTPRLITWCREAWRVLRGSNKYASFLYFVATFLVTICARDDMPPHQHVRPSIADFLAWVQADSTFELYGEFFSEQRAELQAGAGASGRGNAQKLRYWIDQYQTGDLRCRTFGVSKRGAMVVGPRAMEADDCVCVFAGGELAHVLRPSPELEDRWMFVGECFVEELNEGQGWNVECLGGEEEWFSLV